MNQSAGLVALEINNSALTLVKVYIINNYIQSLSNKTMLVKTHEEHPKMVNISAHIPFELAQRLERIAKLEERTKSYYVKKSLEEYLEDIEDCLIAKKGYNEYVASGNKGTTLQELATELNIDLKSL